MGNILQNIFQPVFDFCVNLMNQSMTGLFNLTFNILSFIGCLPVLRWPHGTGLTLWENYAEDYGVLTLKHYEDLDERALCINVFNEFSNKICQVLMIEKKRFGARTQCYIFKEIPGTNLLQVMKIPITVSVDAVVQLFKIEFDD